MTCGFNHPTRDKLFYPSVPPAFDLRFVTPDCTMPQPLEASCFSGNSIQSIISFLYATTFFFFFSIKEQPLSDFFGLPGQIAYPQPTARDWQSCTETGHAAIPMKSGSTGKPTYFTRIMIGFPWKRKSHGQLSLENSELNRLCS